MSSIAEILRTKDLDLKKIAKESQKCLAVTTVMGTNKPPKEFENAASVFQSTYDHLSNVCKLVSQVRKANISTTTDATDYFTGKPLSVVDCRQNVVGEKNVGLPSMIYHMKALHNYIVRQTQNVAEAIKFHNNVQKEELRKLLDIEYKAHVRERDAMTEMNESIPTDFESNYETKVEKKTNIFWAKNKAVQMDPLNVFSVMEKMFSWLNNFEKTREMKINKANHGTIGTTDGLLPQGENHVSLEELITLTKDQGFKIKTSIERLAVVSWKIGDKEQDLTVKTAEEDLKRVLNLIQAYGNMQSTLRIVTTLTPINIKNPLTGCDMSAVDVVDFKHIVIPVLQQMSALYEKQKSVAATVISNQESSLRSDVIKMIEGSMTSSGTKPTLDKMKEYASGLIESLSTKIVVAQGVDKWLESYQRALDFYDCEMKNALSTANANTQVAVTWDNVEIPVVVGSWDDVSQLQELDQFDVVDSLPQNKVFEAVGAVSDPNEGWGADSVTTWETNAPRAHNAHGDYKGKGKGRGRKSNMY